MPGVSAPSGLGTSISVSSVRVFGSSASAMRVTLPGNRDPGSPARGPSPRRRAATPNACVLRHVNLGADHVALHHGEHEGAGGGVGLHQASHVDIALGDDAVEWRDHALIILLLLQHVELRLLRDDVGLRDADRRVPAHCSVCWSTVPCCCVTQPLSHQRLVAAPGDIRQDRRSPAPDAAPPRSGRAWPRLARSDGRARAP